MITSQTHWARGNTDDREDDPAEGPEEEDEREPDADFEDSEDDGGIGDDDGLREQMQRFRARGGNPRAWQLQMERSL